jgi:hypothetical protein
MDNELVGLILALAGLVVGIVAWVMAYGDARTGAITPAVATITAVAFCAIIAFDLTIAKKAPDLNPVITPGGATTVPENPPPSSSRNASTPGPRRSHSVGATEFVPSRRMMTRSGFPIGFRRGWSDWQKNDLASLATWAKQSASTRWTSRRATVDDLKTLEAPACASGRSICSTSAT